MFRVVQKLQKWSFCRDKPPKKFADNELQTLFDEDDTKTPQELAESRLHLLDSHGKDSEYG